VSSSSSRKALSLVGTLIFFLLFLADGTTIALARGDRFRGNP
jgi:hypothetical protein